MDTVIRALQWSSSRKRLSDTRAEEAPANRTELEILREEIEIQVRSELAAHAQKLYDTERARAYVEGHAFGVTEAKIAAEKELARTREDSEAKVASALAALEQAHQAASSKLESSVGEVAFAAVCRLVGRQATSQAFVLGLVGQTCRQSRTETSATVRMHPRDLDTLRALNPQLLRLVTPADPEFVLQLPAGTAERFSAEIAAIPAEKWLSWRRHTVGPGETLSGVAKRYHVLPAEIARANELQGGAPLEEGKKLIIPAARSDAAAGKLIRYRVRRTDTIASIADEFDVSVAELRKWNGLRSNHVAKGVRLRIYPGGMSPSPQAKPRETSPTVASAAPRSDSSGSPVLEAGTSAIVHHVKAGETLWSIARAYQTTVEAIQSGNRYLFSRPLQVGDTLTILPSH